MCSLCGGMTDRGKQILWGARVNASALLSLAASVRTYSHLLLPEEVKQRREEREREWQAGRREMEEVQCSLPYFTCVTARTTDQNVYLAWSTKLYLVDGGIVILK